MLSGVPCSSTGRLRPLPISISRKRWASGFRFWRMWSFISSMRPAGNELSRWSIEDPVFQARQARINFKVGTEKTHFAFTDAQFALWQESENTWGVRLEARPIRTDANLTDTGLFNVSGIWRRAPGLLERTVQ